MVVVGRVFLGLSFLALITAWASEFTGAAIIGLSQQHLFSDATVLALLGIGSMVDAYWHGREG